VRTADRAMAGPSQLPLPLSHRPALSRADLIVVPANAEAVAFIDAWPDWPVSAAALYGPQGCGKTHLVSIWQNKSHAHVFSAFEVFADDVRERRPLAIENVDVAEASPDRDAALFAALEAARPAAPLLLTGREPPASWTCVLPDLASRFAVLAAFPLWAPDESLLFALARKLFADRQLLVPDSVIDRMLCSLERSPGAIRDFVAEADAAALASGRSINLSLVRRLVAAREPGPP
jgi:chromosomal replication initiation ATPase DnaA